MKQRDDFKNAYTERVTVDTVQLRKLWNEGLSIEAIGRALGVSGGTVQRRANDAGLPRRTRAFRARCEVIRHVSAVTMPADPVRSREDWPEIEAAIARAKGSAVALGQVAARYGLPYAVAWGIAGR